MLFPDVVRSMDIAAAVGAERLPEIMADLADHSKVLMAATGSLTLVEVACWRGHRKACRQQLSATTLPH